MRSLADLAPRTMTPHRQETREEVVATVGLGYVGLPVALAFAREFKKTIGFDIDESRITQLKTAIDRTEEIEPSVLKETTLEFTADPSRLKDATFVVVTVPTPVDANKHPDLGALRAASRMVGQHLRSGAVVVYESTVYPGVTEEVCVPILAEASGLTYGKDFSVGYSPERINPGDKLHTLERTIKVVSGNDEACLARVADAYSRIVPAGVHRAPSIAVAEAAKVIENTQRDLNIALMNELALIFDRMGIRTRDVLAASGTKWNFLPFQPGLVGGHCIGVDPYYLTARAEMLGYHPEVILAGRRINDGMGAFIAQRLIKMLIAQDIQVKGARVGVLGLTFKENVPDLRNSRVPDIVRELQQFGIQPSVHDPRASAADAMHEYQIELTELAAMVNLDAVVLAVPHTEYGELGTAKISSMVKPRGVILDVKSKLDAREIAGDRAYWCL